MEKNKLRRGTEEQFQIILAKLDANRETYSITRDYRIYSDTIENIFYAHQSWSKEEFYKEVDLITKKIISGDPNEKVEIERSDGKSAEY